MQDLPDFRRILMEVAIRRILMEVAMGVGECQGTRWQPDQEDNQMELGQGQSLMRMSGLKDSLLLLPHQPTLFEESMIQQRNGKRSSNLTSPEKQCGGPNKTTKEEKQAEKQENQLTKNRERAVCRTPRFHHTGHQRFSKGFPTDSQALEKGDRALRFIRACVIGFLLILITTPIANGLDTELRAFSCSSPSGLKDYMVHYNESCGSPLAPDDQQLRSYTIVQRRNYNPAQGYRCTKRVSRFTFVCTSNALANHQRMASIPQVEVPQDMTREECQNLVMNEEYEGPDGVKYQVPMNKTTVLRFHEAGREEITGGTITCYGEKLKVGNRLIDGVAILEQVKFHVQAMI